MFGKHVEIDSHAEDGGDAVSSPKTTNAIDRNKNEPISPPQINDVDSTANEGESLTDRGNSNADASVSKNAIETFPKILPSRDGKVVTGPVGISSLPYNSCSTSHAKADPSPDKSIGNLQETAKESDTEQGSSRMKVQSIGSSPPLKGTETGAGC
jgi:hypothetical protein